MHDLKTLKEINRLTKLAKSRRVARSLNKVRGSHKDAEKGRAVDSEPWEELSGAGAHKLNLTN